MESTRKSFILGIGLSLFTVFIASDFLLFTWGYTIEYYVLVILVSFLGGAVLLDFERSLKLVSATYIISSLGIILLYALPIMVYGGDAAEVNVVVAITTVDLAKTALISLPISIFACLFGCFSGRSIAESE